mmetsp:Transcript_62529/g.171729  ORF Transcript_62529/g.171729 Transcript_62529/m.171729 type:complete len:756 (+) Transcript_62529:406-2673(+)
MESSAWTNYVRRLFEKLTGTAIAPKTLRSIFITWLKESTDCPDILKSAAHAMKHQQATQASAHYDANADTKLVKAAYDFNLTFAAGFGGGGSGVGSGSGEASGSSSSVGGSGGSGGFGGGSGGSGGGSGGGEAVGEAGASRSAAVSAAVLTAKLNEINFTRSGARGKGDCYPLSAMAGFEISSSAARAPRASTTAAVREVRKDAVALLTGGDPIGGIDAHIVRESELIPAAPEAARAALAPWLQTGFWFSGDGGNTFTFFMLGVAIHLGRPIAVIERRGSTFLDTARVYGARDAQGALVRTSGKGTAPVTVPAFKCMPLAMLLEKLRASPTAFSLVEYNGSNHFSPWIYKSDGSQPPAAALAARARGGEAEAKPPSIAGTELADGRMDDSSEADMLSMEAEAAADDQQASARSNHLEFNLGLVMPSAPSALAGAAREALCRSKVPLPGEGEAAVEVNAMARLAAASETDGLPVAQVLGVASSTQPPPKRAKKSAAVVAPPAAAAKELTLEEALAPFAGLKPIEEAPEWLEGALDDDEKRLHGRHVVFKWEEWGFACGKIGPTRQSKANFGVNYEGGWKEEHTLEMVTYGTGEYGSWMLLEGEVTSAPPLVAYAKGKYLVRRSEGDVWKPASELLFHSSAQMEAARSAAQVSKQAATQAAVEDEMRAPHAVGDVVYVKTFSAGGEQHFRAEVLAVRDIFPPVQVKFLSTLAGDTNPLLLPAPLTAFVTADKIDTTAPAVSAPASRTRTGSRVRTAH